MTTKIEPRLGSEITAIVIEQALAAPAVRAYLFSRHRVGLTAQLYHIASRPDVSRRETISADQRFVHRLVASRETAEDHLKIGMGGQHGLHLANGDLRRLADGIAVHTGRDAGKGNRTATVLDGDRQRVTVAPSIIWFAALTMASTDSFVISPCSIRII